MAHFTDLIAKYSREKNLTLAEHLVYEYLLGRSNNGTAEAFPHINTIAKELRFHRQTVIAAIARLQEPDVGLLLKVRKGRVNHYTVLSPYMPKQRQVAHRPPIEGATGGPQTTYQEQEQVVPTPPIEQKQVAHRLPIEQEQVAHRLPIEQEQVAHRLPIESPSEGAIGSPQTTSQVAHRLPDIYEEPSPGTIPVQEQDTSGDKSPSVQQPSDFSQSSKPKSAQQPAFNLTPEPERKSKQTPEQIAVHERARKLRNIYATEYLRLTNTPYLNKQAPDLMQIKRLIKGLPELTDEQWAASVSNYLRNETWKGRSCANLVSKFGDWKVTTSRNGHTNGHANGRPKPVPPPKGAYHEEYPGRPWTRPDGTIDPTKVVWEQLGVEETADLTEAIRQQSERSKTK